MKPASEYTREEIARLLEGLEALPSSWELEVDWWMQVRGLDRDEAELMVGPEPETDA